MTDKILEKMKKLLALSENNTNEHEAMAAAKALHVLLSRHNISLETVHGEGETEIGKNGFESRERPWKRQVAGNIAQLYFCKFYFARSATRKGYSHYYFVGENINRTFAEGIYKMVIKTIERASRKASREQYGKENSEFVNSFWSGAAITIGKRCQDMIDEAKSGKMVDEEGQTLPALISVYETAALDIRAYYDSIELNLVPDNSKLQKYNRAGYNAGEKEGERVSLRQGVHKENAPKMISN